MIISELRKIQFSNSLIDFLNDKKVQKNFLPPHMSLFSDEEEIFMNEWFLDELIKKFSEYLHPSWEKCEISELLNKEPKDAQVKKYHHDGIISSGLDYEIMDELSALKQAKDFGWMQGFVCAVCINIKSEEEVTTETKELFAAAVGNRSLETLKMMGVDEYDLFILDKYWKELH
jgi:hypothetical protein